MDGHYNYEYTGKNVKVFVIDTGMRLTHSEFGGRATCGFDVSYYYELKLGWPEPNTFPCEDIGLIGGKTVGVAKEVELVSVKVSHDNLAESPFSSRSMSDIIYALLFIRREKLDHPEQPMVAQLSMVYGRNQLM